MGFWESRRVLVTGAGGFLGSYVVEALRRRGCARIHTPRREEYDLVDGAAVRRLLADCPAEMVMTTFHAITSMPLRYSRPPITRTT